jgi:hypothetical protein
MAVFTGTDLTYTIAGATGVGKFNREDLTDLITNISPTERPFVAAIGRSTAKSTLHEWMHDVLRAATTNAQLEGDDFGYTGSTSGTRLNNRTQIMRETIIVSGTQDVVDKAGMSKWLTYQVAKKSKELGNDLEWACLNQTQTVTGASGTARQFKGVPGWVTSNVVNKTSGTETFAVTQTDINLASQNAWTDGGSPNLLLCGAFNKRQISSFTTGVTKNLDASDKRFVMHVDVYETDFGIFKVVPDHFIPADDIWLLDPALWSLAYLRPLSVKEPALTGDASKRAMLMEVTLVCRAEEGNAGVINTTTA